MPQGHEEPSWKPPPLPADGEFPVTARFAAPGTYVLRVMAHDGGLISTEDVRVTVTDASLNHRQ